MGFLDRLKRLFSGSTRPGSPQLEIVVQCNRCKEIIRGQINLHNDLSVQYDGNTTHYYCRKGLVGSGASRCFQQVVVAYTFDANRNVIDRQVEGGRFVDEEA